MSDIKTFDLNLLRVFQALMSELNATVAAEKLGVSQAAVSAALKRLRTAYDDPLFERTQRGFKPTPRAIVIAPLIEEAIGLASATFGEGSRNAGTVVRLGLSDDFELAFGASIISRMHMLQPDIRLVFRQTNSVMAVEALHTHEIDLALTSGGFSDSRIKHRSLGSSHYLALFDPVVRGSDAHLSVEEFVETEHILISYSGLTGITDDVLGEHGYTRKVRAATTHFSALPFLLRGSDAIATMPSHAARAIAATGMLATSPAPLPYPEYSFGLSWRFDATRNSAVRAARGIIAEIFA